ncbi:hypothetical protein BY458DRAFT_516945 [Sporodiniella umbellata]|nr:hypothetical protein BY458DRAFT_516945 [Sporodiniella umbellata]
MSETKHKHHRSMPSLSFSILTTDTASSPRTSQHIKRHSDSLPGKRWDDSPFEMELAEDDWIQKKKTALPWTLKWKRKLDPRPKLFRKVSTWLA